jgi:hypothetical protein
VRCWLTGNIPAITGSPFGISSIKVWCTRAWFGRLLLLGVGAFLGKVPHHVVVVTRSLGRGVSSRCCGRIGPWLSGVTATMYGFC